MSASPPCTLASGPFVRSFCSERLPAPLKKPIRLPRNRGFRAGFSLIEMVVVVAIVAVVATVGITNFSSSGPGLALSTSTSQVSSVLAGARQLAVSTNCKTRFFILLNEEPNKPEWRLRGYGVLKQVRGSGENSTEYFIPATQLYLLRDGIYFQRDLPETNEEGDPGEAQESNQLLDRRPGTISLQNVEGAQYAYIEFEPDGGTVSPSAGNIIRIERGLEPGVPMPNQTNYARIGVAQHTGRVKVERPNIN